MSQEDRDDIIKKVETSGNKDNPKNDDFGDSINGEDEQPTDESIIHETGIEILPKDHKQVFVNAKLGVDDSENKKLNNLGVVENKTIFAENSFKTIIMKKLNEVSNQETTVEPTTKPAVEPVITPTRRQKPWKVRPNVNPQPKAEI